MDWAIINKKMVRTNKALKAAGKSAKKRYGRVRMTAPKAVIKKVVDYVDDRCIYMSAQEKAAKLPETLSADQLIEQLKESGLTGLSGDGYAVSDKIRTFVDAQCEKKHLIVNGVECDPGLLHDEWIYEHLMNAVLCGVNVLQKALPIDYSTLVVKSKVMSQPANLQVVQLPARYPMGYEKEIIKSILGKTLSKEEIPASQGILVLNIQTVLAIGDIVCNGVKADNRYLTVADLKSGRAQIVKANVGSEVKEVFQMAFPDINKGKLYTGSGALHAHPITKGETVDLSTNLIALSACLDYEQASNCKGCGACSSNCPANVKVHKIVQAVEKGQKEGFGMFHPERCIGCSACTYVCRAGKNTQRYIAYANGKCGLTD